MNAWWLLLGTLGYNYRRHRQDRSTICSVTRRVVPRQRLLAVWGAFSAVMLWHLADGYDPAPGTEQRT